MRVAIEHTRQQVAFDGPLLAASSLASNQRPSLRLADEGVRVGDVCRQMGIAEKTFPPDGYVPEMRVRETAGGGANGEVTRRRGSRNSGCPPLLVRRTSRGFGGLAGPRIQGIGGL
jgi:hypothetical protein